jgi:hypothetical protein
MYAAAMGSRRGRAVPPGLGPGDLQALLGADLPDSGLGHIADETGGGYVESRFAQNLASAFGRVAEELHRLYLLRFAPAVRNGKVYSIKERLEAAVSQDICGAEAMGRATFIAR